MLITSRGKKHLFLHADSSQVEYDNTFGLVLTSPPFFHPERKYSKHGFAPATDLDEYARYVSSVLLRAASGLRKGRFVCVVKTDVWHRGTLIPVGFRLVDECVRSDLVLRAHWVWQKLNHYSPYSPSFANVFLLGGNASSRPCFPGILSGTPFRRRTGLSSSYTPEIFQVLIHLLTRPGDAILDPYAGAGSVLEAAANTGRRSIGIDISPRQFHLAKRHLTHAIPGIIFRNMISKPMNTLYQEEELGAHER